MTDLVECVPNFSEGRRRDVIDAIVSAIRGTGARILDVQSDAAHNRCVVTFVAPPAVAEEAAFAGAAVATARIDLRQHQGEHPRMGATDVVPFVPFGDLPMATCVSLAHRLGSRLARDLQIPVYYYGEAARLPERRELERVRRGGFEELREHIRDPDRIPDEGPPAVHPTAGATAVAARIPLIAYNINLKTTDVGVARDIARKIRASSGGLPSLKALGFALEERGLVQVSMNLTDYRVTSPWQAFRAVKAEAQRLGIEVVESEIVGTIPLDALVRTVADALQVAGLRPDQVLEQQVWTTT